jgi:23S rRNA (uracil1939-C5)-methyltransferase
VLPPLAGPAWHSRRKARLSVRDVPAKGRVLVGFRERDGRFITDMQECHTLDERLAGLLPALSALLGSLQARATIPQLEAACGDESVALVVRHLQPLSADDRQALVAFEQQQALRLYLQPGGPDSVVPLSANGPQLSYALPAWGLELSFEPLDFIQVNAGLNQLMVAQALEQLDIQPGQRVLDLFCGLGNFSLPLARAGAQVTGVEGAPGLVARAQQNATDNGLACVHFIHADLYADEVVLPAAGGPFDSILLDPPRSGAGPLLAQLAASGVQRIVYISCNPKTLAADAGALQREHGFELLAAGLMDMFPHTPHSEAMAVFERRHGA